MDRSGFVFGYYAYRWVCMRSLLIEVGFYLAITDDTYSVNELWLINPTFLSRTPCRQQAIGSRIATTLHPKRVP